MEQVTIFFRAKNTNDAIELAAKMIKHNISFDFLNGLEFYLFIHDEEQYQYKRDILGENLINEQNIIK